MFFQLDVLLPTNKCTSRKRPTPASYFPLFLSFSLAPALEVVLFCKQRTRRFVPRRQRIRPRTGRPFFLSLSLDAKPSTMPWISKTRTVQSRAQQRAFSNQQSKIIRRAHAHNRTEALSDDCSFLPFSTTLQRASSRTHSGWKKINKLPVSFTLGCVAVWLSRLYVSKHSPSGVRGGVSFV